MRRTIRRAEGLDAPALASLQSCLREPSPTLLAEAFATGPTPADVIVSTADDEPVGYLLAVPGDETVYVAELAVAPAYRREGRGRALLSACLDEAGDASVTVTVAPENETAQSCYRHCGFERVRRLPGFFDDGPALLYRWSRTD